MRICIFCSSKLDFSASMLQSCREIVRSLSRKGYSFVYGGAQVGLMGLVADEAIACGSRVVGFLPRDLFSHEVPHRHLTELVEVADLMERKKLMMENSDAFLIFPGGVGTLDEFFEVLTWKSLGCFDKTILVYNPEGFWDSLLNLMKDLESKQVLTHNLMTDFKVFHNPKDIEDSL